MAGISSSVGLITGIPIEDTIEKLLAISARPRDTLTKRNESLAAQQVGISDLAAQVISVQLAARELGGSRLFDRTVVRSSDTQLITATSTGTPAVGSYRFTPVRQAQSHQLISRGLVSATEALGGGDVKIRFGGAIDEGLALQELNGGAGVQLGRIRISDRSGASQVIDLRFAETIDDVLTAINTADGISVTATTDGDRLVLTDTSGQAAANLKVQEVGQTSTAADLGLGGVNVAAAAAVGDDVLHLHDDLRLAVLNDGNGVYLRRGVADLRVNLADGSLVDVDFLAQNKGETSSSATTAAQHGVNAQVTLTSVGVGAGFDGYTIAFQNDDTITAGSETVTVDTAAKRITFKIDHGNTRAAHIVNALNNNAAASAFFTAAIAPGGNGTGVVTVTDTGRTAGGAVAYANETTLGDIIDTINAASPGKLQARISGSGDALELVDLSGGAGAFTVANLSGGTVAEDLGLTTAAAGNTITGERRLAGLKTVLLDSLAGGAGLGELGLLTLTNRAGASTTVNLAAAKTLQDVLNSVNAAGVGISATVNAARNGLELVDTSGGSGNLIVANGDAANTADKLQLAVNAAVASVNSSELGRQTFHENLRLDQLHHGRGVKLGSFLITDSSGQVGAVNLKAAQAETVGDVIQLVNGLGIGVTARINDAGDGLLLEDTAGGSGDLRVVDSGSGTSAADLKLAGVSSLVAGHKVIDGSLSIRVVLAANESLQDLAAKINAAGDVTANVFNGGSGATPFRLAIASGVSGAAGELLIDSTGLNLGITETAVARDALVAVGAANSSTAAYTLATSPTNDFDALIDGVSLDVTGANGDEVTITVEATDTGVVDQVKQMADAYNRLQEKLDELSFYNTEDGSSGVLHGSTEVLRIEMELSSLFSGRIFGAGSVRSLEELGLSLDREGKLQFDSNQLREKLASDPDAVEAFFTTAEYGLVSRLNQVADRLAGAESSVLISRTVSLNSTIELNADRIADLTAALSRERERLVLQFASLETVISSLRNNMNAISQIQPIAPLVSATS